MIRIVVADDENLIRQAIAGLLDLSEDIDVVAQAGNGTDAVTLTLEHRPDIVLLDVEMPDTDGLTAAEEILRHRPGQGIILLTRHGRAGLLRQALSLGVRGFLLKSIDPGVLENVIRHVNSGKRWIDADLAANAMMDDCPLTDRELDTLRLTDNGYSVREIGSRLHLASGTVRNYLSSAMQKTGTGSRHAAARTARERGWI